MKGQRPQLALCPGTRGTPTPPEAPGETAEEVSVIQCRTFVDVTRLLMLDGDPSRPHTERAARAAVEVRWGNAHPNDTQALIDDLVDVLERHARRHWALEVGAEAFARRARFEVLS